MASGHGQVRGRALSLPPLRRAQLPSPAKKGHLRGCAPPSTWGLRSTQRCLGWEAPELSHALPFRMDGDPGSVVQVQPCTLVGRQPP